MLNFLKHATVGTVLLLTSSLPLQAKPITLKFASTVLEEQLPHVYLNDMIQEIEAADVGISIKFFPASQLGSGEELFEDARFGNVDMVYAVVYAQADPRLGFMDLPFMITTLKDVESIVGDPKSAYNQIMTEIMRDHGLVHLGSISEGLVGVVSTKMPKDVKGTGNKELSLRVWSSKLVKQTMDLLGYQTTTMAWAEVFPAIQAGTIDGAICCTAELAYTNFAKSDVGTTFIPYNAFIEHPFIYMSSSTWSRLSDEQKKVISAASLKASNLINASVWDQNQEFLAKLRAKGWTVVDFTGAERAKLKKLIVDKIWPGVGKLIGKDLLARLTTK